METYKVLGSTCLEQIKGYEMISICCERHPKYKAKRRPTSDCDTCISIYVLVHGYPGKVKLVDPDESNQITYDVVAYNESWGGYGEDASKRGFKKAETAINYAKGLGKHLDATVWKRITPKPVEQSSVKIWPHTE